MEIEQLREFFEEHDFRFDSFKDSTGTEFIEMETWTEGGVNMIIYLEPPNPEEFFKYVEDFNMDEEIDLHREMKGYKKAFTISESVKDFTKYKKRLNKVSKELKTKMKELSSEKI